MIIGCDSWINTPSGNTVRIYSGKTGDLLDVHTFGSVGDHILLSVAGLGDFDNDSFSDYAVGVPDLDLVYIYSGQFGTTVDSLKGEQIGDWYGFAIGGGGDANSDGTGDLVDYLFGIPLGPAPPCPEEGNGNGDGSGDINISDITYLVDYLFGIPLGPEPPACP